MNSPETTSPNRDAAVRSLAVIGFISLVCVGMALAVYATRFIPTVVNGVAGAAVYVGSLLSPASPTPGLTVIPTSSTTIPFGTPVNSVPATPTAAAPAPVQEPVVPTTPAPPVSVPTPVPAPALYGLPDLSVTIDATGYLTAFSTDSFTASPSVPYGARPAIRFTVKNSGTNTAAGWQFSIAIPENSSAGFRSESFACSRDLCVSAVQPPLAPGETITYTLGFETVRVNTNQTFTVVVNSENTMAESNKANNTTSTTFLIRGS